MSKRRVVVTGLGMLSPVGNTVESTWKALLAGQSGISLIDHFDTSAYATKFAGLVKDFNCEEIISRKEQRKMDAFIQYGIVAGVQAMQDSGLEVTEENATRIGAAIGSGIGGLGLIEENHSSLVNGGPRKISPFFVPSTIVNMVAGHLTIMFGLRGPSISIATACTSGVHNIGQAARIIAYGDADAMVAGGAEELCPSEAAVFDTLFATSQRNDAPKTTPSPFDVQRDGLVIGEGAGTLVLEALDHARARGATIYGEIVGFATNCDAAHITQPQRETMQVCMEQSLAMAGLGPQDIGYISAHGTATDRGDIAESQATAAIFGDSVPISSLKSYFGHTLGACGALEALLSLHMMREGWFTPTLNLRQPDEQCGALDYIMGETRPIDCEFIQSNNFAFGGINTSIIIKRWA